MDNSDVVQLYVSFKDDSMKWLDLHHKHFTEFVTIVLALLAASLGAAYQFRGEGWFLLSIAIGPSFSVFLCFVATATCDRFYQRFLEHEAIADKLFALLGLSWPPSLETAPARIFADDEHLYPQRWVGAHRDCKTIDQFVKRNMGRGSNRLIRLTFRTLAVLGVLIALMLVVLAALMLLH